LTLTGLSWLSNDTFPLTEPIGAGLTRLMN
jgi:hypothetical protein